jgi:hypothetical protein
MSRRIYRTYRLDISVTDRIQRLADDLNVRHSQLVELLLAAAFDEIDAGRWPIHAEPVLYRPVWTRKNAQK